MSSQLIIVTGNLGKDPEMKFTPTGQNVTGFSVATSRKYPKGEQMAEETIWFRVEVWGKQAEACNTWLQKGSLVQVRGRLKPIRIYTDGKGQPAAQLEINAEHVDFLAKTKTKETAASDVSDDAPF